MYDATCANFSPLASRCLISLNSEHASRHSRADVANRTSDLVRGIDKNPASAQSSDVAQPAKSSLRLRRVLMPSLIILPAIGVSVSVSLVEWFPVMAPFRLGLLFDIQDAPTCNSIAGPGILQSDCRSGDLLPMQPFLHFGIQTASSATWIRRLSIQFQVINCTRNKRGPMNLAKSSYLPAASAGPSVNLHRLTEFL
jgi:hypothetical protein